MMLCHFLPPVVQKCHRLLILETPLKESFKNARNFDQTSGVTGIFGVSNTYMVMNRNPIYLLPAASKTGAAVPQCGEKPSRDLPSEKAK
jgi:hypothetical protein